MGQLRNAGMRGSNSNRRRHMGNGGGANTQMQQDRAALSSSGSPYQQGTGAHVPGQTAQTAAPSAPSTNNMTAQMAGPANQQAVQASLANRMGMGGHRGAAGGGLQMGAQAGMAATNNAAGLQSIDGRAQTSGYTTGGYNGGMNMGNGIPADRYQPPGGGDPLRTYADRAGGYQGRHLDGNDTQQQDNNDPQDPGQQGGDTDDLMEDSIRAALEAYLNGPDEGEIMDRYGRRTDQNIVDARARMGSLGMSGSGASASLQAGLHRQGADMAQGEINNEKQRLMGNAMAATGLGMGLDDMAMRRALIEQLTGGGDDRFQGTVKGGGGAGGDGGDAASAVHAPDWAASPLGAASDWVDRATGGMIPGADGNFLNDWLIKHPANLGAAAGEALFGGGGTPGTGEGGSFNTVNNMNEIPPDAVMLELDQAAQELGVPSLPFGTKVYKTPDGQIWVYTEM